MEKSGLKIKMFRRIMYKMWKTGDRVRVCSTGDIGILRVLQHRQTRNKDGRFNSSSSPIYCVRCDSDGWLLFVESNDLMLLGE